MSVTDITSELNELDKQYMRLFADITESDSLVPAAKKRHLEEAKQAYREAWLLKKREIEGRLQEKGEELYRRAYPVERLPSDPQKALALELKRARVSAQAERLRGQDGKLLRAYDHALKQGDAEAAKEFEEIIPDLLTIEDAKKDFAKRAKAEKLSRMGDSERRTLAQLEKFGEEHFTTQLALDLQETNRRKGYVPQAPESTQLITQPGRSGDAEVVEKRSDKVNRMPNVPFPTEHQIRTGPAPASGAPRWTGPHVA